jgi:polyhydroxyalkanoate synthesis repressor PhaR
MPLIKRYPNRKLYDTEAKSYITLEGVAALIRNGEDVQVIDHESGEDLTTLTLTQIILEEEKRQAGFLPRNVLSSLVRAGGETVGGVQRALASSLGWWTAFDEEVQRRLDDLVARGEMTPEEASRLIKKIIASGEIIRESAFSGGRMSLENYLRQQGVPSRDELEKLNEQIDALSAKIDAYQSAETEEKPASRPKTRKKAKPAENQPTEPESPDTD